MIVHACHCTDCRRLGGAPYAINAWTEAENIVKTQGELGTTLLEGGESGQPNEIWFCKTCGTTVWCRYHVSPQGSLFVKVGTLDDPRAMEPDVHIWTRSKLPSTVLPDNVPCFDKFYDLKEFWPAESMQRLRALISAKDTENRESPPAL